ncbi:rhamnulokinase family protein [Deinococcus malanensis]
MVPDLLHYWLSGRQVTEQTNASTTQLYDPRLATWSRRVLDALDLPEGLLPEVIAPGTVIGEVSPGIALEMGLKGTRVIAPATHDTASAVAAVPAQGPHWAYLSSGTWSLVGVETLEPVITPAALRFNLTNEAGVHGTTRLLKNIMGLWILQECRRSWSFNTPTFEMLYAEAEGVPPSGPLIDPDDPRFLAPGLDMPARVQQYCRDTDQAVPESRAAITRCVLDSLALRTAEVLTQLEAVTGNSISTLHVVGGGSQIRLLNQLIADASGCTVIAGPVEATLIGNLLVQAEACGRIPQGGVRDVVRASEAVLTHRQQTVVPAERRALFARLGERATVPS